MTTKVKIIFGFAAMVIIAVILAVLGYSGLQKASTGFEEYRRLARFNVLASDMVAGMGQATEFFYLYTTTDEEGHVLTAKSHLDKVSAMIKEADEFIRQPERKKILQEVVEGNNTLSATMTTVETDLTVLIDTYSKVVLPSSHKISAQISGMHETELNENDPEAAKMLMSLMGGLGTARSAASRFSQSRDLKDAARALETLTMLGDTLEKLGPALQSREAKAQYAAARETYETLVKAMTEMNRRCEAFQKNMQQIENTIAEAKRDISALSASVNTDMLAQGAMMLETNASLQKLTLGVSIGGVILGLLLAAICILGIIRVLRELGVFAGAIAQGNFNYQVKIREKGEVGQMVAAMQQIPAIFQNVINQCNVAANRISSGLFNARLDEGNMSGGFKDLVGTINIVASTYTKILDDMPLMLFTTDMQNKMQYANTVGAKNAGGNAVGNSYTDALGLPPSSQVATSQASGELTAHPGGKRMEVAYFTTPLHDVNGKQAGALEIVNDVTQSKDQQATMMKVASDASEISNRVAAASEELSAQVEQVSRGAEMQRSRVESTASAMAEMNSTVLEVARNAGHASEQSDLTRNKANDGSALVGNVVKAISAVESTASVMHNNIQELGQQAESIGSVMSVISDIADQTNLLALNAAIEAARAGEAGRGFAVVADEVRKLAEKTMTATHEVGSNITAIQESTQHSISAMNEAINAVQQATELAGQSGQALNEIVEFASSTSAAVSSIATAAEEQSATSEEINRAVEEINQVVGETTDGMVQASAAVQELSRMAQELNRVMEQMN